MFAIDLRKHLYQFLVLTKRSIRSGPRSSTILEDYATLYRPEVESELEYLAVQTSRKKSLQINYEIAQQRQRQQTIRYHILRRKYVAHPNDIQVNPYVKNHMQFLYKNYPKRWTVQILAESFNQSIENVRLILQQRTKRGMRVRPRSPSSLFGVKDEDEAEKLLREHVIKRDLINSEKSGLPDNDDDPVDYQILAEESNLLSRRRPSDSYLKRENDGFFSNVISSTDEMKANERDISMKKKLLVSSTLLERINKLRRNPNITMDLSGDDLDEKHWGILEKMQQSNDSIVEMNERKEKFVKKFFPKK